MSNRKKNPWDSKRSKADLYSSFDTAGVGLKTAVKFHKLKREIVGPLFTHLFLSKKGFVDMMGTKTKNQQQEQQQQESEEVEEQDEENEDEEDIVVPERRQNIPSSSTKTKKTKTNVETPVKRKSRLHTKSKVTIGKRNQPKITIQKSTTKKTHGRQVVESDEQEENEDDNIQEGPSDGLSEESD